MKHHACPSRPFFVGIAGASASGKSLLAEKLHRHVPASAVLSLDSYYYDLAHLSIEQRQQWNFDHPDALEQDRLIEDLQLLQAGFALDAPLYRFDLHTRDREKTHHISAGLELILVEGLFTLYWGKVRQMMDLTVFVEASEATCLERRVKRDVRERGRTPESARHQYISQAAPMFRQYGLPGREKADLVVDGEAPPEGPFRKVLEALAERMVPETGLPRPESAIPPEPVECNPS